MSPAESASKAELLAKIEALSLQLEQEKEKREATRRQLEQQNVLSRLSTLHELLEFCHEYIDQRFGGYRKPAKTWRGGITNPTGKHCPLSLEPWEDFEDQQAAAFEAVEATLVPAGSDPVRLFSPLLYIQRHASSWKCRIPDLVTFQDYVVQHFVEEVTSSLPTPVTFANLSHVLGENPDSPVEPGQDLISAVAPMHDPQVERKLPPAHQPTGADQLCVFRGKDDTTDLLMIQDYKAPHTLTNKVLRAALREQNTIDITQVRDEDKIPQDPTKKFLHGARTLISMAAAETYGYMLRSGCTHGCIITGESIVFLKIKDEDTTSLLYYFTEPPLEAVNAGGEFRHCKTFIAQLVSFCSMAFGSPPRSQAWIREATEKAPVWNVDHDMFWTEAPKKVRELLDHADRADTTYHGPKGLFSNRESYPTRLSESPTPSDGCKTPTNAARNDHDDYAQEDKGHDNKGSPEESSAVPTSRTQRGQPASRVSGAAPKQQQRQYCTQACILGLAQRGTIDESCPNASLHPRQKGNAHSLSKTVLRDLLRQQLAKTMDEHCLNLKLSGARGTLFKLSLAEYGYTFVGKATIDRFIPCLQHEGRIYDRLRKLQGQLIPVCLGNIDLDVPWYGLGVNLVHMLLMSYGGEYVVQERTRDQIQHAEDFETTIAAFGVQHKDMRSRNILWNQEIGRWLFIDFERSTTFEVQPKSPKIESPKPTITSKVPDHKACIERKALQQLSPSHSKLNRTTITAEKPAVLTAKASLSTPESQSREASDQQALDPNLFSSHTNTP
ncbi:MAG: hypothetical protein LQ345_002234 [Seirophora villosa]|nr:MAG: hypothetical protein LQ345_002234 [Seirophora villosa]